MDGNRHGHWNIPARFTALKGPLHYASKESAMPRKDKARFPASLKAANDDRPRLCNLETLPPIGYARISI